MDLFFPSSFQKAFRAFGYLFGMPVIFLPPLLYLRVHMDLLLMPVVLFFPALVTAIFFYMGYTSGIRMEADRMIYKLLTKTVIPYSAIRNMYLDVVWVGRYARYPILALFLDYAKNDGGKQKKLKIHIETFERFSEILDILKQKTRKEISESVEAKKLIPEIHLKRQPK